MRIEPSFLLVYECIVVLYTYLHIYTPQELGLQPEDSFILKVVQLEELLHVRHSIFVIGNAGTGKTKILRSLHKTYQVYQQYNYIHFQ